MPPPPPPPGPPPPPVFDASKVSAPDPEGRNMLLESIRQGKQLKKVKAVNDRSAPQVDANKQNSGGGNSGPVGGGSGGGRVNGLNAPPGLGGLFAGGMPKLKPVGSTGLRSPARTRNTNNSHVVAQDSEQGNGNESYHNPSISAPASLRVSPAKPTPPQPPPSNLKPLTYGSQQSTDNNMAEERRNSHGKPSLAPKPPALNGPKPPKPNPPPKLFIPPPNMSSLHGDSPSSNNTTPLTSASTPPPMVARTQSMRMPKPASPTSDGMTYNKTIGRVAGREMLGGNRGPQPPPPPRIVNGGRPRNAILRPPSARPPPPPNKAPPSHPPPPPPTNAPPPPPHRTVPAPAPPQSKGVNGGFGPLPPVPNTGPPPPPVRNTSMQSVNSGPFSNFASSMPSSPVTCIGPDLEARFSHLFHSIEELAGPAPFTGFSKTYPSKNAQSQSVKRQPAPQPPTHLTQVQLGDKMWVNNTSTC